MVRSDRIQRAISLVSGRRMTFFLLALNVMLPIMYVTGWSSTVLGRFGQQQQKKVEKHRTLLKLPLEVSAASIGNKPITLGESFDNDVDWLKGLKIKAKNKSDKTITWAYIVFRFPETRLSGPVVLHEYFIGQRSDMNTGNPPLELKPNEEVELSLESHFAVIKRSIEKRGRLDEINDVDIEVQEVMFDDGTLYSGDTIWKPNPDTTSPHKWVKVGPYLSRS